MNKFYLKNQFFRLFLGLFLTIAPPIALGGSKSSCISLFNPSKIIQTSSSLRSKKKPILLVTKASPSKKDSIAFIKQQANKENVGIEFEGLYNENKIHKADIAIFITKKLLEHFSKNNQKIKQDIISIRALNIFQSTDLLINPKIFKPSKKTDLKISSKKNKSSTHKEYKNFKKYADALSEKHWVIYKIFYSKDGQDFIWEVKREGATNETKIKKGIEITSPILRTEEDRDLFYKIITDLKNKNNIEENPTDGGIHIHLDPLKPDENSTNKKIRLKDLDHSKADEEFFYLKRVFKSLFIVDQSLFEYFMGEKTSRQIISFKNKIDKETFTYSNSKNLASDNALLLSQSIEDSNMNFYINSIASDKWDSALHRNPDHGTWEFRLFNSTLNPKEIEFETEFVTRLFAAAKIKDQKLIDFTKKYTHFSSTGVLDLFKILFTEKELDDYLTAKQKEKLGLK